MSRPLRAVALAAATVLLVVLPASAAMAEPVLAPADAQALSEHLRRATDVQGICYGWQITVRDDDRGTQADSGSNLGVGVLPTPADSRCRETVLLRGDIHYPSAFSEAEDSARWDVSSTMPRPSTADVARAAGVRAGDLLGDDDDRALYSAVAALPLVLAEAGAAPIVPAVANPPVPATDSPDDVGSGSDFLRENGVLVTMAVLLLVVGLAALARGLLLKRDEQRRTSRRRKAP